MTALTGLALLLSTGGAAASPTVYVGGSDEYAVAFASEAGETFALELAGAAHCYGTEPYEDLGSASFSVLTMPRLMHQARDGLAAGESGGGPFGGWHARVRISLEGDLATGAYFYDQSEESQHCDTSTATGRELPFEARRYAAFGTLGFAPRDGETTVYLLIGGGPVEAFLRTRGGTIGGIRGSFGSNCAVGRRSASNARRWPLFPRVESVAQEGDGSFRRQTKVSGQTRSGAQFEETMTLTGTVEEGAISGDYRRVRRTTSKGHAPRKCRTGPLPFDATRYLPPAAG